MKWIITRCLLAAPVIMFYSLFSFHAFLISGCSTDTTHGGGGGPRFSSTSSPVLLSAPSSTDSTGHPVIIHTSGKIPAGSSLVLSCTSPEDCKLRLSTDTTVGHGGVRMVILGTITEDIPDNTELALRIIPKGDPAMKEMVR